MKALGSSLRHLRKILPGRLYLLRGTALVAVTLACGGCQVSFNWPNFKEVFARDAAAGPTPTSPVDPETKPVDSSVNAAALAEVKTAASAAAKAAFAAGAHTEASNESALAAVANTAFADALAAGSAPPIVATATVKADVAAALAAGISDAMIATRPASEIDPTNLAVMAGIAAAANEAGYFTDLDTVTGKLAAAVAEAKAAAAAVQRAADAAKVAAKVAADAANAAAAAIASDPASASIIIGQVVRAHPAHAGVIVNRAILASPRSAVVIYAAAVAAAPQAHPVIAAAAIAAAPSDLVAAIHTAETMWRNSSVATAASAGAASGGTSTNVSGTLTSPGGGFATAPAPQSQSGGGGIQGSFIIKGLEFATVKVLYATDRKPLMAFADWKQKFDPKDAKLAYYGGDRDDRSKDLRYGRCFVSMPISHKKGDMERPRPWMFEEGKLDQHILLRGITELNKGGLQQEITTMSQGGRDTFIFTTVPQHRDKPS